MLGLHITEGLAKVNSETKGWHFPFPKLRARPIMGPNATCAISMCNSHGVACGQHIEEEVVSSNYTRVVFKVTRYGYGWGLKGTAIKLAHAALLLHCTICLAQTAYSLWIRRTFYLANSIGELVALACNSMPTRKLNNTRAGIESISTWTKNVVVRETGSDHLEMVFEDGSDDELVGTKPRPGKKYA